MTWLGHLAVAIAIVVGAWLLTRLVRAALSFALRRVAERARTGKGTHWRVRLPRVAGETEDVAMLRRDHRVDATVRVFSRVASVVVWFVALLVALSYSGVDVVLAVSGAGFVGFAIAIGAQHTIHDGITGLHILLEDRFGAGDHISVRTLAGLEIDGRVTNVGVFSTRIEGDEGTYHLRNHTLNEVCNHSQRGVPSEIQIHAGIASEAAAIASAVQDAYDDVTAGHVIIDAITPAPRDEHSSRYRVSMRTRRPLTAPERDTLTRGAEARMRRGPNDST